MYWQVISSAGFFVWRLRIKEHEPVWMKANNVTIFGVVFGQEMKENSEGANHIFLTSDGDKTLLI